MLQPKIGRGEIANRDLFGDQNKKNVHKKKTDSRRHQELLREKNELEQNRPHDIEEMRRWKHSMGKVLQELELFKQ